VSFRACFEHRYRRQTVARCGLSLHNPAPHLPVSRPGLPALAARLPTCHQPTSHAGKGHGLASPVCSPKTGHTGFEKLDSSFSFVLWTTDFLKSVENSRKMLKMQNQFC
jgi:hypothetical protein